MSASRRPAQPPASFEPVAEAINPVGSAASRHRWRPLPTPPPAVGLCLFLPPPLPILTPSQGSSFQTRFLFHHCKEHFRRPTYNPATYIVDHRPARPSGILTILAARGRHLTFFCAPPSMSLALTLSLALTRRATFSLFCNLPSQTPISLCASHKPVLLWSRSSVYSTPREHWVSSLPTGLPPPGPLAVLSSQLLARRLPGTECIALTSHSTYPAHNPPPGSFPCTLVVCDDGILAPQIRFPVSSSSISSSLLFADGLPPYTSRFHTFSESPLAAVAAFG